MFRGLDGAYFIPTFICATGSPACAFAFSAARSSWAILGRTTHHITIDSKTVVLFIDLPPQPPLLLAESPYEIVRSICTLLLEVQNSRLACTGINAQADTFCRACYPHSDSLAR